MKKALRLLSVCLALLLTGCTGSGGETEVRDTASTETGEKTVIRYYDSTDSAELSGAVVAAFNAQSSDTFVDLQMIDNDAYDDTIADMLESGDDSVDCLFIRQPCQVNRFAAEGLLADLTDAVAQSDLDPAAYGQALDIVSIANTIPGLPRTKSVWLLFYNRDIFDRYGLDEPSDLTWDEYADLTLSLTVRQEDGSTLYGGYIPPWTLNLGAAAAGEYLYDDELPYTRRYIELLNRLYNVDHSHPDVEQMDGEYSVVNDAFLDQKVATMINGDWVVYQFNNAYYEKSRSFRWGIATLPVFEGMPKKTSVGSCSYLCIPVTSRHQKNAFEFISFFCGGDAADILARLPTSPAYYTESSAELYQQSADVPGTQYVFDSFVHNEEGAYVRYRELNVDFKARMLEYLRGSVTLDEAFQNFESDRLPIMQQQ